MCHRRYPREGYGSPAYFRRRGDRYRHGCHHHRGGQHMQNNIMGTTVAHAMAPVTNTTVVRVATPTSNHELPVSDDPPAYDEGKMADHIDLPESVRRSSQIYLDESDYLDSLGRQSGYIMCPRCDNESHIRTYSFPRSHSVLGPISTFCYSTGILAPLLSLYISKYGDQVHYCRTCGSELTKWKSADRNTRKKRRMAPISQITY